MKNLARWSFVFVIALSISSFGTQPQVEEAAILANDSQDNFNQENQIKNNFLAEPSTDLTTNNSDTNNSNPEDLKTENLTELVLEDLDESQTNNQTNQTDNKDNKLVKKTALVTSSAVRTFRATAYCLKGRTATGGGVRRGVVAADRRILPLGTKIYVNAGSYSGIYTVTDTGGAVRGNILDVWVPSCSEANRFGRRTVTVSIMGR